LGEYVDGDFEIIALPYFHGLTNSVINEYPGKVSLVPCFHDEPQFYWGTTEKILRHAKLIFFNSAAEKQMTIREYGHRVGRRVVESVVTGVGVELPISVADETDIPEQLPERFFVYAGRKEVGKNVPLLCQWFTSYIENSRRDTKLVFIGGGDNALIPASDQFVDLGFVSEAKKQHVIRRSLGVINLSENESFSIVIMEAWLLGVPVVVSAECAVTRDHVRTCNGGLFIASGDEFDLALGYLEDHEEARKLLAAQGKQYVAREFSFDAVLARYLREFRRHRNPEELCLTGSRVVRADSSESSL
jgi:glycosyltransferase involved in cell wall biosynthesis